MFDASIRETKAELKHHQSVLSNAYMPALLKTVSPMIMVLTRTRQVVYCNQSLSRFAGLLSEDDLLGSRPGEAFQCEKSDISRHGCGGSVFCKYCGFNQALFDQEAGKVARRYECQLITRDGDPVNLAITLTPFDHQDYRYMFCVIENIENEKYRKMLEGIFIHDLKNSISSLHSLAGLSGYINTAETQALLKAQLLRITEELENYELLQKIEEGRLPAAQQEWVSLRPFIDEIIVSLKLNPDNREKRVRKAIPDVSVFCQKTLLRRVLANLVKNAMEAESDKAEITISVIVSTSTLSFKIKNPSVMSDQRQKLVFTRFASSKGEGRGLGTYGARKIVTDYLNGKISFVSVEGKGTVFTVRIPKVIKERN